MGRRSPKRVKHQSALTVPSDFEFEVLRSLFSLCVPSSSPPPSPDAPVSLTALDTLDRSREASPAGLDMVQAFNSQFQKEGFDEQTAETVTFYWNLCEKRCVGI